jgi:hypothetical protein
MDEHLFERVMANFTFTGTRVCGIKDGLRADGSFSMAGDDLSYLWDAKKPADWFVRFPLKECADLFGLPYTGVIDRPDLQETFLEECKALAGDDFIKNGKPVTSYANQPDGSVRLGFTDGRYYIREREYALKREVYRVYFVQKLQELVRRLDRKKRMACFMGCHLDPSFSRTETVVWMPAWALICCLTTYALQFLSFLSESEETYDVLVGSDGIWSSVRAQMYGEEVKSSSADLKSRQGCTYSGYTVFAGECVFETPDYYETGYKVYIGPKRYFVTSDVGGGRVQW